MGQTIKVANSAKEISKEHTVYATNTRIPYKYSREILVSPTNHREIFTDTEYPRVTYTRKNINSNPFVDTADSMIGENRQPDPPAPGFPGFLSPQLPRTIKHLAGRRTGQTEQDEETDRGVLFCLR